MSWERTERTLSDLQERLGSAQTPEQCQAIGQLARDSLISLAQSGFRADTHWQNDKPIPSPTDSKRQLEAYVDFALAGGSKEEVCSFLRAAVQLSDALTHKRTATPKDTKLSVIATEAVIRFVATIEEHEFADGSAGWEGVEVRGRYFSWGGPKLHALDDRAPIPAPFEAIEAMRNAGHKPVFGLRDKLHRQDCCFVSLLQNRPRANSGLIPPHLASRRE
jgi:hypothetical protein